jgi:transcriptional regulator with GAF, ATPase, and Fis domain
MSSPPESRELLWLRRVRDVSRQLATETDLGKLFPAILEAAVEITRAERGFVVRVHPRDEPGSDSSAGARLKVEAARGFNRSQLRGTVGDVSRTVVERVVETGEGLVTTREEDADVLNATSVKARRVLSIICVPMKLRGDTRGVLYLDHRFLGDAFDPSDLPALGIFADQAALALETAELRADTAKLNRSLQELEAVRSGESAPADDDQAPDARTFPVLFGGLVGNSPPMCALYEQIERSARTWDPVLIQGDLGTGKGLVAAEIHARSEQARQPLIFQTCAAPSDEALEAELCGLPRSKTAAPREGTLVRAGQGTLVLEEVADLSPTLQGRLVSVLRTREVLPVGGTTAQRVQCRLVALTRHDLRARVEEGLFREDLFYRLDVQRIAVPALRDRVGDLLHLATHFSEAASASPARGQSPRRLAFTDHALELLRSYVWPGNVRELENEVRRLTALDVDRISARQLSPEIREGRGVSRAKGDMSGKTLGEMERAMVEAALEEASGNKARAARQLGIPRSSLYSLLERYGLK